VVAELDGAGAGVVVGVWVVGVVVGVWVVGVVAGDCAGLPAGGGVRLGFGGISAEAQVILRDGLGLALALALALAEAAPPPWPLPGCCGLPLPDVVPPPPWPDPDDGPGDEPMFAIACRTPGTAAAVPPNNTMAPTTSAGFSQTVPSRCRVVRVLASVAVRARRPVAAATAANAISAGATAIQSRGPSRRTADDIFFTPSERG
jgi:hypothetical protein